MKDNIITCDDCEGARALASRLCAHAETIERIERGMREHGMDPFGATAQTIRKWANALRGDKP